MKAGFFILSWLMTLFIGALFGSVISGEVNLGFAFSVVAAVCSTPFIILFSILMHHYIKRNPSKRELHVRTLFLHILGSCFTITALAVIIGEHFPMELLLATFGYFVIDSLFFHAFNQIKHEETQKKFAAVNDDILDSPIED